MSHELVVVGASLGGLSALETFLGGLPADFPPAITIVQHRSPDSGPILAELLSRRAGRPVSEPEDQEPIRPARTYLAPPAYHLMVERDGRFALSTEGAVSWARPSIDVLFESAAMAYGRQVVAVLLTGSSDDGAAGVAAVGSRGGITLVEDPATAESPVAPLAALASWPPARAIPLAEMAPFLLRLVGDPPRSIGGRAARRSDAGGAGLET